MSRNLKEIRFGEARLLVATLCDARSTKIELSNRVSILNITAARAVDREFVYIVLAFSLLPGLSKTPSRAPELSRRGK